MLIAAERFPLEIFNNLRLSYAVSATPMREMGEFERSRQRFPHRFDEITLSLVRRLKAQQVIPILGNASRLLNHSMSIFIGFLLRNVSGNVSDFT